MGEFFADFEEDPDAVTMLGAATDLELDAEVSSSAVFLGGEPDFNPKRDAFLISALRENTEDYRVVDAVEYYGGLWVQKGFCDQMKYDNRQ